VGFLEHLYIVVGVVQLSGLYEMVSCIVPIIHGPFMIPPSHKETCCQSVPGWASALDKDQAGANGRA